MLEYIGILEKVGAPLGMALAFLVYLARRDAAIAKKDSDFLEYVQTRDDAALKQQAATADIIQKNTGALGSIAELQRDLKKRLDNGIRFPCLHQQQKGGGP